MTPLDRLVSEVFAVAKQDLQTGDVLDGIGGSTFYSLIDTYEIARREGLLPIGLAKGARLIRPVKINTPITWDDVEFSERSTILILRRLQDKWMAGETGGKGLIKKIDALADR
jgi:predicted homoserine dehydrogenase-like protein